MLQVIPSSIILANLTYLTIRNTYNINTIPFTNRSVPAMDEMKSVKQCTTISATPRCNQNNITKLDCISK